MAGPSALWEALQALLPRTKEELKLELGEKVEGSVVMLLQEAAELFHGGQRRKCLQTCEVLLDYSWEKLNTGPWQHVDKDWRRVYAFGCLLKAVCLCEPPGDAASVAAALKACDMGLLMGAAILGDILLKVAAVLQKHLLSGKRPAPGPSQELPGTKAWGWGGGGVGAASGHAQQKCISPIFLEDRGQLSPGGKPPGVLTPVEKWHLHQFGNRASSFLNFSFFFFSLCKSHAPWGEWEGGSFVAPEKKDSEGWCGQALFPTGACLVQLLPGPWVEVSPTFLADSVSVAEFEMLQLV